VLYFGIGPVDDDGEKIHLHSGISWGIRSGKGSALVLCWPQLISTSSVGKGERAILVETQDAR
jgi:hypothetical protein